MFLKLYKKTGLIIVLLFLILLTGCRGTESSSDKIGEPGTLTITGNGVAHEKKFTIAELQEMDEALASERYSTINNWLTKKFYEGKGIRVSYLLEQTGIKDDAQIIVVRAADDYNITFTREQLEEERFYFPNLLDESVEGIRVVPTILVWEYRESTDDDDFSEAASDALSLFLGQKGLNDVVAPVYVRDVIALEVLTSSPGQWDMVQAEPLPGKVEPGTEITLKHPQLDYVKIYYTLDGSNPDEQSLIYNPSTTYYRPELIEPITVNESVIIKTLVAGFGKQDSQVAVFEYEVE